MVTTYQPVAERKIAEPVGFSEELAEAICEAIATTPRGLDWLCAHNPRFPTTRTIEKWRALYPDFRMALGFAKQRQGELLAYEALEIADDDTHDVEVVERRNGETETRMNFEYVARSKLKVETRLKLAAKLDPKVWGDKQDIDLNVGFTRQEDALAHLR